MLEEEPQAACWPTDCRGTVACRCYYLRPVPVAISCLSRFLQAGQRLPTESDTTGTFPPNPKRSWEGAGFYGPGARCLAAALLPMEWSTSVASPRTLTPGPMPALRVGIGSRCFHILMRSKRPWESRICLRFVKQRVSSGDQSGSRIPGVIALLLPVNRWASRPEMITTMESKWVLATTSTPSIVGCGRAPTAPFSSLC